MKAARRDPNSKPNLTSISKLLTNNTITSLVSNKQNQNLFVRLILYELLQGLARTQIPTNINYAVEFPTFGEIAGVNPTGVQWKGLALEEPPS